MRIKYVSTHLILAVFSRKIIKQKYTIWYIYNLRSELVLLTIEAFSILVFLRGKCCHGHSVQADHRLNKKEAKSVKRFHKTAYHNVLTSRELAWAVQPKYGQKGVGSPY